MSGHDELRVVGELGRGPVSAGHEEPVHRAVESDEIGIEPESRCGGEALQPTNTATSVRVRNGKISTTDGPYVETKEQLGGYYLIKAKDLNDAVQVASRIPGAKHGTVEVRPIMEFNQP